MAITLEQQRAADAWRCAQGQGEEYRNLAKGLPALIMNSGLMQVMAFLYEKSGGEDGKKQKHCAVINQQLRAWLKRRFPQVVSSEDFGPFMDSLLEAAPASYQQLTAEALAWLRWARQMAAAANI